MKAYDNRIYHDRQKEPFYDPEWIDPDGFCNSAIKKGDECEE